MAESVLVDAGFLIALLTKRNSNHRWAAAESLKYPPPWSTCEAALSEAFYLLGVKGTPALAALLRRGAVLCSFAFGGELDSVLALMDKYADVPMSLADGCLVRMSETLPKPVLLTTDNDFRIYRRHSRQAVPCVFPV